MPRARSASTMTFEQAYRELEDTVKKLEAGNLPLEQALALFERGQALAARCSELLDQAEIRLRRLVPDSNAGYVETDFPVDEE